MEGLMSLFHAWNESFPLTNLSRQPSSLSLLSFDSSLASNKLNGLWFILSNTVSCSNRPSWRRKETNSAHLIKQSLVKSVQCTKQIFSLVNLFEDWRADPFLSRNWWHYCCNAMCSCSFDRLDRKSLERLQNISVQDLVVFIIMKSKLPPLFSCFPFQWLNTKRLMNHKCWSLIWR